MYPFVCRAAALGRSLAVFTLVCAVLSGCKPPPPPPPRPAPAKPAEVDPAAVAVEDPQAKAAARTDGLTGGTLVFSDDFAAAALSDKWQVLHEGEWVIDAGALKANKVAAEEARNQGIWLRQPLPDKTRIEFTAWSLSKVGDTKCEVFATEPKHEAGYSVIFGGWSNTINTIARKGEHEPQRKVQSPHVPVETAKRYRWSIVRTDNVVRWYVDGKFMLAYDDAEPVRGNFFGMNNWATEVRYDDIQIYAL